MSGWVKVSTDWFDSDQVEDIGAEVAMLHLSALAYSARQLTDGLIPARHLRKLWPVDDLAGAVNALEEAGWWESVEDGWQIQEWSTFILESGEVERRREKNREYQERHRRHNRGDHSMCQRCAVVKRKGLTNVLSKDVSQALSNGVSDPIRSEKRRGSEDGAGPAGFADPTGPPADGTPFLAFMRAPKAARSAAEDAARAELGDKADPGAVTKRAAELLANGEVH